MLCVVELHAFTFVPRQLERGEALPELNSCLARSHMPGYSSLFITSSPLMNAAALNQPALTNNVNDACIQTEMNMS